MITSLIGARNPHVLCVHSGIPGSVRLVLKALATIYKGALQVAFHMRKHLTTFSGPLHGSDDCCQAWLLRVLPAGL